MDKSSQYWLNTALAAFIMPGVRLFGNCIPDDFSQLSQDLQIPWLLKNPIGPVVRDLRRFCKFNFCDKTRMFAYYLPIELSLPTSVLALHPLLLLQKGWSWAPRLLCSPRCQVLARINCQCCSALHCLRFWEPDICSQCKFVQNRSYSPEHNSPYLLPGTCSDGAWGKEGCFVWSLLIMKQISSAIFANWP